MINENAPEYPLLPEGVKDKRHLTLQSYYRIQSNKTVPMLRISGVWLEKAGFGISQKVEVTVGDGVLIIQKDI